MRSPERACLLSQAKPTLVDLEEERVVATAQLLEGHSQVAVQNPLFEKIRQRLLDGQVTPRVHEGRLGEHRLGLPMRDVDKHRVHALALRA